MSSSKSTRLILTCCTIASLCLIKLVLTASSTPVLTVSARRLSADGAQEASELLKSATCSLNLVGPNTTTLHSLGAVLDVSMDTLVALNPGVDLSNPINVKPGMRLTLPCPGTAYPRHMPLYIAGEYVSC